MVMRYWWGVTVRASRETAELLGWRRWRRVLISAPIFVAALLILRFSGPAGTLQAGEEARWVSSIGAAAIGMFLGLFLWKLLILPARLQYDTTVDADSRIKRAEQEHTSLLQKTFDERQRQQLLDVVINALADAQGILKFLRMNTSWQARLRTEWQTRIIDWCRKWFSELHAVDPELAQRFGKVPIPSSVPYSGKDMNAIMYERTKKLEQLRSEYTVQR